MTSTSHCVDTLCGGKWAATAELNIGVRLYDMRTLTVPGCQLKKNIITFSAQEFVFGHHRRLGSGAKRVLSFRAPQQTPRVVWVQDSGFHPPSDMFHPLLSKETPGVISSIRLRSGLSPFESMSMTPWNAQTLSSWVLVAKVVPSHTHGQRISNPARCYPM
ncbi:hypothetical protein CC2G_000521 [Coprinopsis cinerea AmutBmut pab1-1]|nr:hypothetical protein CC2G_000521 [Coprinopsis cinerea AmutBmut pab1-1]